MEGASDMEPFTTKIKPITTKTHTILLVLSLGSIVEAKKARALRLKRLRILRDEVFSAIDISHLNFSHWCRGTEECGTFMCLGGYAAVNSKFYNQGLHLTDTDTLNYKKPQYKSFTNFNALEQFFGVTWPEGRKLFSSEVFKEDEKKELHIRHNYLVALIAKYGGKEKKLYKTI